MADHNDDSNISSAESTKDLYQELPAAVNDHAVLLILQGLEGELNGQRPSNTREFINKLNSSCIHYCLKQSALNPNYSRFNYYPTAILTAIFNINVITTQPINFPQDDAGANSALMFTTHETNTRDTIGHEYYEFISIIYELYRRSGGSRVPSGLDRIIKYLEENKPQIKSSEKR